MTTYPETLLEIERATGMSCLEAVGGDPQYNFLRCKLGRWELNENNERVFRVISHGHNWGEAYREFKLKGAL